MKERYEGGMFLVMEGICSSIVVQSDFMNVPALSAED